MEKYEIVKEITKDYLEGTLEKLTIQYEKDNVLNLSIEYEDSHNFRYDYDMEYDTIKHLVKFVSHQSTGVLYRVNLDREESFEEEIRKAVFNKQ